jgi:hypothetical protein
MGSVPPPPPLSLAEFRRRWQAGARTLAELDPDLMAFHDRQRRFHAVASVVLVLGSIAFVAALLGLWAG